MSSIIMICFVILGCSAGGNKTVQDQGDSLEKKKVVLSLPENDTIRPLVTSGSRLEQIRQYMDGDNEGNKKAVLQSPTYEKLPRQWVGLQLTDTGYVEYKPCNGINHSVEIKSDTLIVNWALESLGYLIKEVNTIKGGYMVRCFDGSGGYIDFTYKEVSEPANTYVVSWNAMNEQYKWLVTPAANRYSFGFVTNPCPENMLPEKEFNEINFGALKLK